MVTDFQFVFQKDKISIGRRKQATARVSLTPGTGKLIINNVLVLEFDNRGLLVQKKFYDKEALNKMKFTEMKTENNLSKRSFVESFLSSVKEKMYNRRK